MSGSWSTVYADPTQSVESGLAADHLGNVYSISINDSGTSGTLAKETGGQWTNLLVQNNAMFSSIATDSAGDVLIAGATLDANGAHFAVWKMPAGQSSLSLIDSSSAKGDGAFGIGVDSAGDVYATGDQLVTTSTTSKSGKTTTSSTLYDIVRKLTPSSSGGFVGSTVYQSASTRFNYGAINNVSVINSGPAAGIYVVGSTGDAGAEVGTYWQVFKSSDSGVTWSLADQFQYDAASNAAADAYTVSGDGLGNVYVAGTATARVLAGYVYTTTKVRGQLVTTAAPYYNYLDHWIVRKSASGNSGSWSTTDDFLPSGFNDAFPFAIGADLAGNMYVAGGSYSDTYNSNGEGFLRTNTGGTWSTSDTVVGPAGSSLEYGAVAADSLGNLYVGGEGRDASGNYSGTFIRSTSGPAPGAPMSGSAFSSLAIAPTGASLSHRPIDDLFHA